MAHRGLLREAFGLICMGVIVKETEKASTPIVRESFIDEFTDVIQNSTTPPLITLPKSMTATEATGLLPVIFTLLVSLLGFFGDQIIEQTFEFLLLNGLLPLLRIIKRYFLAMIAYANRCLLEMRARMGAFDDPVLDNTRQRTKQIDEESRSGPPQATPATSNGNEDGAQDPSMDVPNPTAFSPETEQPSAVLETLLKESAEKDVQIRTLFEEVQIQAQKIANLDQRNNSFETELRTALDPTSLHPPSKGVVAIASDLAEDFKHVSTEAEREKRRLENAANDLAEDLRRVSEEAEHQKELEKDRDRLLAEKEDNITRLSEESTKLSSQIKNLVDEQRSSALATANTERQAKATEKRLRERVQAAEHTAANSYDERTYMTLRNQFDVVVGQLNSAKNEGKHAIDAQGRLATELEAERAKVAQVQAATHEEAAASQRSESLMNTKTAEIQLANQRVASLEREVQDKCRELEDKGKESEDKG